MGIPGTRTMDDAVLALHRFTVDEYYRMAEAGILTEDDRVELLDGQIVRMAPIGSGHGGHVNRLTRTLVRALGDRAVVAIQNPVRLSTTSEPQPDVAVLHPRSDDYADAHPHPHEIYFLIEVSDASIRIDRRVKLPLYARADVPEVWIVDLNAKRVEVYRRPVDGRYAESETATPPGVISPEAFPDVPVSVGELFG